MFSEYASKFLTRSQRPAAPLFEGAVPSQGADDDLSGFLGPLQESLVSSGGFSAQSQSQSEYGDDPPADIAIERPTSSLWAENVQQWQRATSEPSAAQNEPSRGEPSDQSTIPDSRPNDRAPSATRVTSTGENPTNGASSRVDSLAGVVYIASTIVSLTTASFIVLTTSPDTGHSQVYPVFSRMVGPLLVYATLSIAVGVAWLYCMRSHARAVVQVSTFAVPVLLTGVSGYSVIMSIHSGVPGHGLAHAAMRSTALVPLVAAALWVAALRRKREATGRATEMIALTVQVFESSPALLAATLLAAALALCCAALWTLFLSRAFLEGSLGILLAAWFSFMYLWTWRMLCSLHRCLMAGVTAQWYRKRKPRFGAVLASVLSRHFGSACLASLVEVLIRLPLFLLPHRPANWLAGMVAVAIGGADAPVSKLLDPLTLPCAVTRRLSLHAAAKLVARAPEFQQFDRSAFRVAKLVLTAARACCAMLVGFLAWVHADRLSDASSAYGYLVAVVALFIGWTVVGACENTLSMCLDALATAYVLDTPPRRDDVDRVFGFELDPEEP